MKSRSVGLIIQVIFLPSLALKGFAANAGNLRKNHTIKHQGQSNVVSKYRALHTGLCPAPFSAKHKLNLHPPP